ncbi:cell division protein ZapA [Dokdonella ginsengisoli]|uniref:Cell division protein ZapA n=1 Tax=Dokdonella ginsengisoli TaxID=363846 RepID=A0ABV9QUH4_9GAMM
MSASQPVSVSILDREFLIACTPEEREGLLAAARYLDGKMREMRNNARTATLDRIAILAALNISHELLGARQRESSESAQLAEKLQALHAKLERALPGSIQ